MGRIIRAFFSGEIPPVGDELLLDEKESQHRAKVLRIQVGDSVQVLDGQGAIVQLQASIARARIDEALATEDATLLAAGE